MLGGIQTDQNWPPIRPARIRGMSVINPMPPASGDGALEVSDSRSIASSLPPNRMRSSQARSL